ncbi:MAG: DUF2878 domain-containing protein [Gammaproteobacteria bacterium]|nr:DUF2878 domain-containing protein [Gammaproteobacteria bacterium]
MSKWFWAQLIAFQILWFSAVIGRNEWIMLSLLLIAAHFIFTPSRGTDWRVIPIALIGITVDATLTLSGIFVFETLPLWLGLIWIGFVLTLGHSMIWLRKLPWFVLVPIGAVAGTASYLAGWKLEAVELPMGLTWTIATLAILWAIMLPLLVQLDYKIRVRT